MLEPGTTHTMCLLLFLFFDPSWCFSALAAKHHGITLIGCRFPVVIAQCLAVCVDQEASNDVGTAEFDGILVWLKILWIHYIVIIRVDDDGDASSGVGGHRCPHIVWQLARHASNREWLRIPATLHVAEALLTVL